jgi:integrase
MGKFCEVFGDHHFDDLTADDVMDFLNQVTDGCKPQTKRIRYAHLSAFFKFIQENLDPDLSNPCDSHVLRKLFRPKIKAQWNIFKKDTVDEIIFRTATLRDRLLLELMARGAMRIGEVLKLTPNDIAERKLFLREPKSGRDAEIVFIPQKVADRLREYVRSEKIGLNSRIFPICYEAARAAVKKAGNMVGVYLRPNDLRRHAATFASRSGVPIEIISKIIFRHANLSTTQIYLGNISDSEALKWIETLYS